MSYGKSKATADKQSSEASIDNVKGEGYTEARIRKLDDGSHHIRFTKESHSLDSPSYHSIEKEMSAKSMREVHKHLRTHMGS